MLFFFLCVFPGCTCLVWFLEQEKQHCGEARPGPSSGTGHPAPKLGAHHHPEGHRDKVGEPYMCFPRLPFKVYRWSRNRSSDLNTAPWLWILVPSWLIVMKCCIQTISLMQVNLICVNTDCFPGKKSSSTSASRTLNVWQYWDVVTLEKYVWF